MAIPAVALAADWRGRPLAEALNALNSADFAIIYSSALVPADLRVIDEPRAATAAGRARELLEPHKLTIRPVSAGIYAVVAPPKNAAPPNSARTYPIAAADTNADTQLEEIIVVSRYRIDAESDGAQRLTAQDFATQPMIADDPLRAVARLPGVAGNTLSARVRIRGGDADEVGLLVDGYPIRSAFHLAGFQGLFSAIDAGLIETMDVYAGGFPARFGGRMSGILDVKSLDATDEPRRAVSLGTTNISARAAGMLSESHRIEALAALRGGIVRSWLDQLDPNGAEPNYVDGLAKVRWRTSGATVLTAQTLWWHDRLAASEPDRGERSRIDSEANYQWLRADQALGCCWQATAWLGHSVVESARAGVVANPGVSTGAVADTRRSTQWDARLVLQTEFANAQQLELGLDWQSGDGDFSYRSQAQVDDRIAALFGRPNNLTRTSQLRAERRAGAAFGSWRLHLGASLAAELGLRVARSTSTGTRTDTLFDPRISLSAELTPATKLRLAWGRFHQIDDLHELRVEDGETGYAPAQFSDHLIFAAEHQLRGPYSWRLEAYRKLQTNPRPRFENILNPLALLPELTPDRVLLSPTEADIHGIEASLARHGSEWTWRVAYAWSRAFDEQATGDAARAWDQTHAFNAELQWRRGYWSVAGAMSLHSGWPTTAVDRDNIGNIVLGERSAKRWPWFDTVDLRVRYARPAWRGTFAVSLDVTNALDRRNPCCADLRQNSAEPPGITALEPLNWLPRIPSLSLSYEY